MSFPATILAKKLKALLGTKTNPETLKAVANLQQRDATTPIILIVKKLPGQLASIVTIHPANPPLHHVSAALRSAQETLESQYAKIAVEAKQQLAELKAGPPD